MKSTTLLQLSQILSSNSIELYHVLYPDKNPSPFPSYPFSGLPLLWSLQIEEAPPLPRQFSSSWGWSHTLPTPMERPVAPPPPQPTRARKLGI